MTNYRYTIFVYTQGAYGSTGVEFDNDEEKAIRVAIQMQKESGCVHGVMVHIPGDTDFRRRLVWKDGQRVAREKRVVLSTNCKLALDLIKSHYNQYKRVPTVSELGQMMYKNKSFVEKILEKLDELKHLEVSDLKKTTKPYKITG